MFPHGEQIAVALRSTVVQPRTIVKLAKVLDEAPHLSHMFIPEGSGSGFRALDISSACLAVSKKLRVGSGVIRILEHDPKVLASRLLTFQELSDNRFVLGVGTGRPSSDPKLTIRSMLDRLRSTRESFGKFAEGSQRLRMPETFIAALRRGIARAVVGHSDGILLNLCSPEYARDLITSLGSDKSRGLRVSCYLKIFFARHGDTAKRMLVEELASYDRNVNYHKMFESMGVAVEIARTSSALASNGEVHLGEKLSEISLANPTGKELSSYVSEFRDAGVQLPCLYPYFEAGEDEAFKISRVQEIVQL